jgi:putative DNA primase/helicase
MQKLINHFSKWCVWKFDAKDSSGKPRKIPINPTTRRWASSDDPSTFGTYDEATAAYSRGGYQGIGALMASSSR